MSAEGKTEDDIARDIDERVADIEDELVAQEALRDELTKLRTMRAALKTMDETEEDDG